MRLAEEVVGDVENDFADIFEEMESTIGEDEIKTLVADTLKVEIEKKTSAFLVEELYGLDWLIHHASGVAPMAPEGGLPMDHFMRSGPDRDSDD
jgi:hypothetical protein